MADWLKKNGMEQRELASKLGVPESAISSYIAGKRGLRLARYYELAKITGIEAHVLIEWSAEHQGADVEGAKKAAARGKSPPLRRAS